jgi:hypothetical protein
LIGQREGTYLVVTDPRQEAAAAADRHEAARDRLGVRVRALEEEVMLTPGRRQLRRREAGWEGSPRQIPEPGNTNRIEGGAIWVSLLKKVKHVTINRVVT